MGALKKGVAKRKDKRDKDGFDFRWVLVFVVLMVAVATGVGLNAVFEGESDYKYVNALKIDDGDAKIDWGRYPTYAVNLSEVGVSETGDGANARAKVVEVTKAGTYRFSGVLNEGMIRVNVKNTVARLVLEDATIRNSTGPAIYVDEGEEVVIEVVGESYAEDGGKYDASFGEFEEGANGAIYSRQDLTFTGEGTLNVVANFEDGIVSKDDLKFVSGTYNISAVDDGIRGKDSVNVVSGEFNVRAKTGVKVTSEDRYRKGFVLIDGGEFKLMTLNTGIEASGTAIVRGGKFLIEGIKDIEARNVIRDGGEIDFRVLK